MCAVNIKPLPPELLFENNEEALKEITALTKQIAEKAHASQLRRDGKPYMSHVNAVADAVSLRAKPVAYLHDVIEDHGDVFTAESLIAVGIPDWVVDRVKLLSRTDDVPYDEYIVSISEDALATEVKLADLAHNMSDGLKPGSMLDKYRLASRLLRNTFGQTGLWPTKNTSPTLP